MPEGKPIGGVTLWQASKLYEALQLMMDDPATGDDDTDNPFNGVVA